RKYSIGTSIMVERRIELDRRYHRKKKMHKLKAKLAAAGTESDRQKILAKIWRLSPDWKPPTASKELINCLAATRSFAWVPCPPLWVGMQSFHAHAKPWAWHPKSRSG